MIEIGICCVYKYLVGDLGIWGLVPRVRCHRALLGYRLQKSDFIIL